MKKKIFMIILCIMFIPFFVNAKNSCKIVSGTGNDIGDEIKCGTESFYIVSTTDDTVSMLAKYNLMVGDKIDYFELDEPATFTSSSEAESFCNSEAELKGYDPYYTFPMVTDPYAYNQEVIGCRVYEQIKYDKVVQDEKAIGTKLVNGKSVLPLYGIVYMSPYWGYDAMIKGDFYDFDYDRKGNLKIDTTPFGKYLDGYKEELKKQNIDVQEVSFINLSRTLELLKVISGKEVEVNLEYPGADMWGWNPEEVEFFYGKMDIKDIVGEKNKWVYDITYWLGSGFIGDPNSGTEDVRNDYFISNEGYLCAVGRGECTYFMYPIGQGIRPLIIIPKNEIEKPIVNPETGTKEALAAILIIIGITLGFYLYKTNKEA